MRRYVPLQPPILQQQVGSDYRYQEYAPGAALASSVACYWTLQTTAAVHSEVHRIIPDGCVDLIFDCSARSPASAAIAAGLMTAYETMPLPAGCSLLGVRFYLDHARRFFRVPVSAWSGAIDLDELWGSTAQHITEQLYVTDSVSQRIERLESVLLRQLDQPETPAERLLLSGLQYVYASRGTITTGTLAEQLGYTERTIRRLFQQELGIRPKQLFDIVRFQNLLRDLSKKMPSRFTDAAFQYGYCDQPHLIHQFKRFYGQTPGQVFPQRCPFFTSGQGDPV